MVRVTEPQVGGLAGGFADLASKLGGGSMPSELRETISLNAAGNIKRVDQADESTIYDLTSQSVITINHRDQTWERTSFEAYRAQMAQLGGALGGRPGADAGQQPAGSPSSEPPDVQMSLDVSMEATGEKQDVNGFTNAEQFRQTITMDAAASGQGAAGMSGTMVIASRIWVASKDQIDLTPLDEFDRQLAEELLGMAVGGLGSQDMAGAMMNNPQMRAFVEQAESESAALRSGTQVSTLAEIWMVPTGQEFDADQAFQDGETEPEQQGGGGFGGLLGRFGGGGQPAPPQASGQSKLGGTTIDVVDYQIGSLGEDLWVPPASPYREVSR